MIRSDRGKCERTISFEIRNCTGNWLPISANFFGNRQSDRGDYLRKRLFSGTFLAIERRRGTNHPIGFSLRARAVSFVKSTSSGGTPGIDREVLLQRRERTNDVGAHHSPLLAAADRAPVCENRSAPRSEVGAGSQPGGGTIHGAIESGLLALCERSAGCGGRN